MLVASQRSSRPGHTIEIGSPTLGTVMSNEQSDSKVEPVESRSKVICKWLHRGPGQRFVETLSNRKAELGTLTCVSP